MFRFSRLNAPAALALLPIMAVAIFVRTWHLTLNARMPDTYEQILATQRLLSGEVLVSEMYPPGVAIILAPFFALFPDTLTTVQAVVMLFSLALVVISFLVARRTGADVATALFFTMVIAVAQGFVEMSRVGLFDAIGTTLIVLSIFSANAVRHARWPAWIAFAVLLTVILTIRLSNIILLPAVVIAYADLGRGGMWVQRLRQALTSRPAIVIGSVTFVLWALLLLPGVVSGTSGGVPFTLERIAVNVLLYEVIIFGGFVLPMVLLLAAFGTRRMWRTAPSIVLVAAYLSVAWPLAHAPFVFANTRYMLPPLFFVLLLAAYGPAELWQNGMRLRRPRRTLHLVSAMLLPTLVLLISAFAVGERLYDWPDESGLSDASALHELRPVVAALESDALVVSAMSRGLDAPAGEQDRYYDLIDHRVEFRERTSSVAGLLSVIDGALEAHRPVYYLYSRFEDEGNHLGLGDPGIDAYFEAVEARFDLTETYRAEQPEYRIYRVEPR